jgi:beta-lactamase regulating signal transducer with metallopeptidase domain
MMQSLILSFDGAALSWAHYVALAMWQASIVAAVVLLAVRIGRHWPAPLRAALLLVALLKFIIPPTLPSPVSLFSADRGLIPRASTVVHTVVTETPRELPDGAMNHREPAAFTRPPVVASPPVVSAEVPAARLSLAAWLMLLQAAGVVVALMWIGVEFFRLHRLANRAQRLTDGWLYERVRIVAARLGLPAPRTLLVSPDPLPPMAFGVVRRRILLPRAVTEALAPEQLDTVLAHELAHHRRRDALVTLAQLIVAAVWWFNPLAWLVGRELRRTREECCDDLVLARRITTGGAYCRTMLAAAEHVVATPRLNGVFAMAERMHPLEARFRRIMDPSLLRLARLPRWALVAVAALAAVVLPGVHSRGQQKTAATQPTTRQSPVNRNPSNLPVPGGARVGGTVEKEDGSAAPAVDVFLLRRGTYSGKMDPRKGASGADGGFTFDGVAPGEYRLWAQSGNLTSRQKEGQTAIVKVPAGGESKVAPVKVVLHTGREVHATVTSAGDEKAIAGATIHVPWGMTVGDVTTDAGGQATIEGLTAESWIVEATAPGKAKVRKTINLTAESKSVTFALPDGAVLSGKMTDSAGRPAAEVGINVAPRDDGNATEYLKTGADGAYRFDHLLPGKEYSVLVAGGGFDTVIQRVTLSPTEWQRELNITLHPKPPGGSVAGTVLGLDGKPVAKAKIVYPGHGSDDVQTVYTDAKGAFVLNGIAPMGDVPEQLAIRVKGLAPLLVDLQRTGTREEPAPLVVQMKEAGHTVGGRFVDEAGKPVAGVLVETTNSWPRTLLYGESTHSDREGRFHLDSLRAQSSFDISAAGYPHQDYYRMNLDRDDNEIVLTAPAVLAGKVIDAESGKPVTRFNLRMRIPHVARRDDNGEEFTAGSGEFHIGGLPVGSKALLAVRAEGYPAQYFDDVPALPGGKGEPIVLKISRHPASLMHIAGRIVDASGKPISGVELRLVAYSAGDEMQFQASDVVDMAISGQLAIQDHTRSIDATRSGGDGTFSFPMGVGPGLKLAYWGDSVPKTLLADVGKLPAERCERLELRVPAPAVVTGRINREVYPAASRISLQTTNWSEAGVRLEVEANGDQYKVSNVPPGKYELGIHGKAQHDEIAGDAFSYPVIAVATIEVKEGETLTFDEGYGKGEHPPVKAPRSK